MNRKSAAQTRAELTTKVREAIESKSDVDSLTEAIVDVFADALDEIHAAHGEIPDIKRSTIDPS